MSGLYSEDESKTLRKSHENPFVQELYEKYLGEPGGQISHELLHTHYVERGKFNELSGLSYSIEPDPALKRKVRPKGNEAGVMATKPSSDERAFPNVLELTAENARLKGSLEDANDTIEILKSVLNKNK